MPDRHEDRFHPIACPDDSPDDVAVCIMKRRSGSTRETGYPMGANQERLRTADRRFVQAEADVAGDSCRTRM